MKKIKNLFDGEAVFDSPKTEKLMQRIISIGTKENDIVLDFRQRADYIHSVTIKNKPVPYKIENQHIVIDASYFSKGQNSIFIL